MRTEQTVLIAGATGFLGRAVVQHMRQRGDHVRALVRSQDRARQALGDGIELWRWENVAGAVDGAGVVINFSGENVAAGRWTPARKARILSSRIEPTTALVSAITGATNRPRVLLNASAVGYYGNRGDERLTDDSSKGQGFLADVCERWEEAARAAEPYCRVVRLRFGVVLGTGGGMLARLLPIVSTVGAIIPGSGRQWLPWVAIDDVVGVIEWLVTHSDLAGAINVVAPAPVTMAEFMETLARHCGRRVWGRVPEPLLRIFLGQMARTLTDSTRALPARLQDAGYQFAYTELAAALSAYVPR